MKGRRLCSKNLPEGSWRECIVSFSHFQMLSRSASKRDHVEREKQLFLNVAMRSGICLCKMEEREKGRRKKLRGSGELGEKAIEDEWKRNIFENCMLCFLLSDNWKGAQNWSFEEDSAEAMPVDISDQLFERYEFKLFFKKSIDIC